MEKENEFTLKYAYAEINYETKIKIRNRNISFEFLKEDGQREKFFRSISLEEIKSQNPSFFNFTLAKEWIDFFSQILKSNNVIIQRFRGELNTSWKYLERKEAEYLVLLITLKEMENNEEEEISEEGRLKRKDEEINRMKGEMKQMKKDISLLKNSLIGNIPKKIGFKKAHFKKKEKELSLENYSYTKTFKEDDWVNEIIVLSDGRIAMSTRKIKIYDPTRDFRIDMTIIDPKLDDNRLIPERRIFSLCELMTDRTEKGTITLAAGGVSFNLIIIDIMGNLFNISTYISVRESVGLTKTVFNIINIDENRFATGTSKSIKVYDKESFEMHSELMKEGENDIYLHIIKLKNKNILVSCDKFVWFWDLGVYSPIRKVNGLELIQNSQNDYCKSAMLEYKDGNILVLNKENLHFINSDTYEEYSRINILETVRSSYGFDDDIAHLTTITSLSLSEKGELLIFVGNYAVKERKHPRIGEKPFEVRKLLSRGGIFAVLFHKNMIAFGTHENNFVIGHLK